MDLRDLTMDYQTSLLDLLQKPCAILHLFPAINAIHLNEPSPSAFQNKDSH